MNDNPKSEAPGSFRLGEAWVDPARLVIRCADNEHRVAPKHMAVLMQLVEHAPAVATRTAILNAVWPRGFVDAAVLGNAISTLRRTLEACSVCDVIETVPRRGYRLRQRPLLAQSRVRATWTRGSPYVGLQSFDGSEREIFFGREIEIEEIAAALEERAAAGSAFVLILGPSGSGKTSLLQAGVVPWLCRDGTREPFDPASITLMRGGSDPWQALAAALAGAESDQLAQTLRSAADSGTEAVTVVLDRAGGALRKLLVIDQLERLFDADRDALEAEQFLQLLHSLARSGCVWILAALRSDFYPACLESASLRTLMRGHGHYELGVPGAQQIGRIIRAPAAAAGLSFEVDADSGTRLDDLLHSEAAEHPEILPLLEFTLAELYKRRREDGSLTLEAYRALGGVGGCLARRAEEVFDTLPTEVRDEYDFVFQQLAHFPSPIAAGASRRLVPTSALSGTAPRRELVHAFVAARLFVTQLQEDEPVIGVAHEALFRHWQRLRELLERNRSLLKSRERLVAAAHSWQEHGRSPTYLLGSGPLREAEEVAAQHALPLEARETELIAASRRRVNGLRRLRLGAVAALLVLSCAALGTAVWANWERTAAQTQSRRAAQATQYLLDLFRLADPGQRRPQDVSAGELLESGVRQIDAGTVRDPELQARLKSALGTVYMNLGRQAEAEKLLTEAVAAGQRNVDGDPLAYAEALNALGKLRYHQSRYAESRPYYEQARGVASRAGTRGEPQLAQTHNNLGEMEAALGNFAAAEREHREALRLRTRMFGPQSVETATSWQNLAGVMRQNGQLSEAERAYGRALAVQEAALGAEHAEVAVSLTNLALLLTETGRFAEAEALHRRALASRNETLGESHPQTAHSLHNLSALVFSQGDYARAEPLLRQSIEKHVAIFGDGHATVAYGRNNLATLLLETGRDEQALAAFESAHASILGSLGADHPNTALLRANVAKALLALGRNAEAKVHAQGAFDVLSARLPQGHWRIAAAESIFGGVLLRLGEVDTAAPHLLASWDVLQKAQSADAPTRRAALQRVIELHEARGDKDAAARLRIIDPRSADRSSP